MRLENLILNNMDGIVTLRARQPVLVDVRSANNIQMQLAAELRTSHSRSSVAYTYSCMFFPYEDVVFCSTIKQSSDFRCISVQNPTFRHLICSGGPYSQHRGRDPSSVRQYSRRCEQPRAGGRLTALIHVNPACHTTHTTNMTKPTNLR